MGFDCNFIHNVAPPSGVCGRLGALTEGEPASSQDLCAYGLLLKEDENGIPTCLRPESIFSSSTSSSSC